MEPTRDLDPTNAADVERFCRDHLRSRRIAQTHANLVAIIELLGTYMASDWRRMSVLRFLDRNVRRGK